MLKIIVEKHIKCIKVGDLMFLIWVHKKNCMATPPGVHIFGQIILIHVDT